MSKGADEKTKSAKRGRSTSPVEVTNISAKGLWLFIDETEHFLSYEQFPWFRNARVSEILFVERPSSNHLYWPKLDIDLAVESILNPDRYPLISVEHPERSDVPGERKPNLPRARGKNSKRSLSR